MEIGIIGLPNVGKSTLFNALTNLSVPAENFPFTTIEPNVGIVPLPDERLQKLAEIFNPQKLTSATVKFIDIAGLVKGASEGQGLGNKFLSNIRDVDALIQVVRLFEGKNVANVINKINPFEEISIIETELLLADLEQAQKAKERHSGAARTGDAESKSRVESLEKLIESFNKGIPARNQTVIASRFPSPLAGEGGGEGKAISSFNFLTSKQIIYVLNYDDDTPAGLLEKTTNYVKKEKNAQALSVNASLEFELSKMSPGEQQAFRKELGIGADVIDEIIKSSFNILGLIRFYTVVGTEVRAWSIKQGTSAKSAAGKIHSDMEKGFIKAEVYPFNQLIEFGSEKTLHEKGLVRVEGRDYIVRDADILKIKFHTD
ncbi:MAG: redox-regulated ATPase YchF [Elusimicrobiota bacterium]